MKKLGMIFCLAIVFGLFSTISFVSANTDTEELQPASTIVYKETLLVPSIKVGAQGVGGVTFFNGTIVNNTKNKGVDNPVTFGDNVRIDGILFRSEEGGDNPLKIGDTLKPQTTAVYDLGTTTNQFRNAYFSGTVTTAALSGTGIVNSTNILDGTITGSDISSLSDLNVNTITTASNITVGGNIIQNVDSYGVVKGAFSFNPGLYSPTHNGIIKRFGVGISSVQPISTGITRFVLDISVIDRYFSITPIVSTDSIYPYFCTGGVPIEDPVGYVLLVQCYEPANGLFNYAYVDATYNVLIY